VPSFYHFRKISLKPGNHATFSLLHLL